MTSIENSEYENQKKAILVAIERGHEATIRHFAETKPEIFTNDMIDIAQESGYPAITRRVMDAIMHNEPNF